MGYDCTLHLVDEAAIRDEFVPRLLGRSRKRTALDRVMPDAAELWAKAREALAGDDPREAASLVCQLAVMFSACSLPHQYERGFALSLWDRQEDEVAVEFPAELASSPEPLFAEVVAQHPELHGRFPTWFSGNFSTGVYVPADRVKEVLAWVEGRVAAFTKGRQRDFRGLLGILRAAAAKGLAYWEATDLAIPMAGQFPGDPALMIAAYLGNEPGAASREVEMAPLGGHVATLWTQIIDERLVSTDYDPLGTNVWDLGTWPPRQEHRVGDFAASLARSREGRWLLLSAVDPKARPRVFRPRLYADLAGKPEPLPPVVLDGAEREASGCGFAGETPVVFLSKRWDCKAGDPLAPPVWLEGEAWKSIPGLPAAAARPSSLRGSVQEPVIGTVPLADGGDVIIWDGDGYERRGDAFEKTFAMGARQPESNWTCAPAGRDGFFYLSDRRLFEVHRGVGPVAHAKGWKNIMTIGVGPSGSLLLKEGNNDDGDAAKLYFPADGSFIHIDPALFDDREYTAIHWSPDAGRFLVVGGKFLAVPTSRVLALPRYKASTGKPVR
ncbi:hypothetical protein OJF2_68730 [Aquisphaera giovannonii]|uniref:Uncharacterized protein n=1 Tax=Aquisphaera giovannonii TaxID=406548 RepID=A0A5B9WDX8_9BACT|nr:hypothetical protein [Aquisphaera giovannonii]QEH38275.1 hypothetical protein OJF2_68730 [Aquisphaera giovannonii]